MKNKSQAFILIESVVALFITCLSIFTISLIISCVKSFNVNVQNQISNSYHLSTIQRDLYLGDQAKLAKNSPNQLKISDTSNNRVIFLERYKNMIRIRGITGGHMPLLFMVDELTYEKKENDVIKEKIRSNGKVFESYLFFK